MVILLSLNFPCENRKCSLMFCRAGQDFTVPNFLALPFIFETLQYASQTSSRLVKASRELRPALLSAFVPDCSFHRVLCRIPHALITFA
jgi:hypothetical protein